MAQNAGGWQNSTLNTCLPSTKVFKIYWGLSPKNSNKQPIRTSQQMPLYRITYLVDRWMLIYMYMYTSQLRCVSSPEINYIYKWHPFLIHNSHHWYDLRPFLLLSFYLVTTCLWCFYPSTTGFTQPNAGWTGLAQSYANNNMNKISLEDGDGSAMS